MREANLLGRWLEERRPEIPPPLLERLLEGDSGVDSVEGDALATLGAEALERALQAPGRIRASAFHLLVGDAFLTYSCEALARSPLPGTRLAALLRDLGGRLR